MAQTTFTPGNITTGQPAEQYGSDIIGKVGYFYADRVRGGSPLEPRVAGKLVKVTGFFRQHGNMVFTFSTPGSLSDFTRATKVKFAAYTDQEDAAAVFAGRAAAYTDVYKAYNAASARGDKEAQAYALAALEALVTLP